MKKKVFLAITKGNWGGAQKYVFDLATNIPMDQFDVFVICGEGNRLTDKLQEKNIPTIRMGALSRDIDIIKDLKTFFNLYRLLKKEKPDILHINSSKIGLLGAIAGRLAGVTRIIFTGHGWSWNENRSFLSKKIFTIGHWLTIIFAHAVIAVSEKVKDEIISLPLVKKSKIFLIYNGVSHIDFLERFNARALIGGEISEKFWIGTIAELHMNKNLHNLVRAFSGIVKTHPDAGLIIIGEGEDRKSLESLISELNLTKKIHLLGFHNDAHTLLKAFDVFTLVSRTEAFPYVLLEAGLAQLPVLASRVGGIPELITNGKNGLLVEPNDVKAIQAAIENLLKDSAKSATLGHSLRKTVEEKYMINTMVQMTLDVYNYSIQK